MYEEDTGIVAGPTKTKDTQIIRAPPLKKQKQKREEQKQISVGKKLFDLVNEKKAPKTSKVAEMIKQDPESVTRRYFGHDDRFDDDDYGDDYSITPVHNAASNGHSEALRRLIEAGGDVDDYLDCDYGGCHAIGRAVTGGHYECVKILAEAGANLKEPYFNEVGDLATQALVFGHIKILRYLTSMGVGPIDREDALDGWLREQRPILSFTSSANDPKTWSEDFEDACQENISIISLNKRPVILTACLLKEIGVYHLIDAATLIDLRDYLGLPGNDYLISNYPSHHD